VIDYRYNIGFVGAVKEIFNAMMNGLS